MQSKDLSSFPWNPNKQTNKNYSETQRVEHKSQKITRLYTYIEINYIWKSLNQYFHCFNVNSSCKILKLNANNNFSNHTYILSAKLSKLNKKLEILISINTRLGENKKRAFMEIVTHQRNNAEISLMTQNKKLNLIPNLLALYHHWVVLGGFLFTLADSYI